MPLKGTVWRVFPLIARIALGTFFHITLGSAQFWPPGERVSQESLAPGHPCFAPGQPSFAPVQQAFFGPHTPKHLWHPLLSTLVNFEVAGPLFGIPKTVPLVNRAFVPLKRGVSDENSENDKFVF